MGRATWVGRARWGEPGGESPVTGAMETMGNRGHSRGHSRGPHQWAPVGTLVQKWLTTPLANLRETVGNQWETSGKPWETAGKP